MLGKARFCHIIIEKMVFSAYKPHTGELVVWWVNTSESSLLYVIFFFLVHLSRVTLGEILETE